MDRFKLKQSVYFILFSSKTIKNQLMNKQTATVVFLDKHDSIEPSISEAEATNADRITICYSKRLNAKENRTKDWSGNKARGNFKQKYIKETKLDSFRSNVKKM